VAVAREQLRAHNERLRKAILGSGMTIDEVARHCGMDPKSLERAVAGRLPHPRNRHAIATVLRVDVVELWPEAEGPAARSSGAPMAGVERV
jgi:lambda repressor-like predicted transcriptional regulator